MSNLDDSDDELFFGEITLKEVKRSICATSKKRQTLCTTCIRTASEDDVNKSMKIIETHSTPNILSASSSNTESSNLKCASELCFSDSHGTDMTAITCSTMSLMTMNEVAPHMEPLSYQNITNDSILTNSDFHNADGDFLQIEKLVNNLSVMTPEEKNKNEELDNTLDVIEYILNNGPSKDCNIKHTDSKSIFKEEQVKPKVKKQSHFESRNAMDNILKSQSLKTPTKIDRSIYTIKSNQRKQITPNLKTLMFKTPGNLVSHKKQTITPLKKQFEHVVSPVASYINDSPAVPLLKNVRPKKPLNGITFIPQPINNHSKTNLCNDKNQNLPSTAYRCAKETKVIDFPHEHRLPQSQWAKHVASSLQKGVVMRHIYRKNCNIKKPLFQQQDDSFSNLTLHQADLSVCTQKSAMKKGN